MLSSCGVVEKKITDLWLYGAATSEMKEKRW
jgi:hypothetical protein